MKKQTMTLTEDLISQDSEQDITRLLLSMQEIIATIRYIDDQSDPHIFAICENVNPAEF